MSVTLGFEIDWGSGFQSVFPPRNWKGIQPQIAFTAREQKPFISLGSLEWVGDNAVKLNAYYRAGLTGGRGIGEGVPLRIKICGSGTYLPQMIINLGAREFTRECDIVKAPIQIRGQVDFINDALPSVDFFYLASLTGTTPGRINPATDYKLTPYVISEIPDYTQAALMSISLFVTAQQIEDVVRNLASMVDELIGACGTYPPDIGQILAYIVILVLYIAYLTVLIILLINLIKNLINEIIQKKKFKACMLERTVWERIAAFLKLSGFNSDIYLPTSPFYNATHMPKKTQMYDASNNPLNPFRRPVDEGDNFPYNPQVYGHPDDTAKEFVTEMMDKYNAEPVIVNNWLYFNEKHYWQTQASWTMPNTADPGFTFNQPDPSGTNWWELPGQYYLAFTVETGDLNTARRYTGTSVQVKISPITVGDARNLVYGTPKMITLREELAKRKDHLTRVEKLLDDIINPVFNFMNGITAIINGVLNAINAVIALFGGNGTTFGNIPALPTNIFGARLGWMECSNDSFGSPKTFIGCQVGNDWEIDPSSELIMSAHNLYMLFHRKNTAVGGNQQVTFEGKTFRFCCEDFNKIVNKNVFVTPDGYFGRFDTLTWDLQNDKAVNVNYRIFRKFTNNVQEKITIDGTQ